MALSDIPEYVPAVSGEVIHSADWNEVQQYVRNAVRTHQHTIDPSAPVDWTSTSDNAQQIGSNGIANEAVGTNQLADGAVVAAKLGAQSVSSAALQDNSVISTKLSFQALGSGSSSSLAPGQSQDILVVATILNTKIAIYFAEAWITSATGAGYCEFTAEIAFRRNATATLDATDLYIRLTNVSTATATGIAGWKVLTFAQ